MEVSAGVDVAALCLQDDAFSDVTLVVGDARHGDARHRVHAVIVSRLSPVLAAQLAFARSAPGGGGAQGELRLPLPAGTARYVPLLLRYLYGGRVVVNAANAVPLLAIADALMVAPLHASVMAYVALAVQYDAGALGEVLASAHELRVPLVVDVACHAAVTTCWRALVEQPPRSAPRLPLACAAAVLLQRGLDFLRAVAAGGAAGSAPPHPAARPGAGIGGEASAGGRGGHGLGAAGAAVVASAVASRLTAGFGGPAAQELAAAGLVPLPPPHARTGQQWPTGVASPSAAGELDAEAASHRWLRNHLSGLLRTSAAFPRRLWAPPRGAWTVAPPPADAGASAAGGAAGASSDALWFAAADAQSGRLQRWEQVRRGGNDGESDGDAGGEGGGVAAAGGGWRGGGNTAGHHPSAGMTPGAVSAFRDDLSRVLWAAFVDHVLTPAAAEAASAHGGATDDEGAAQRHAAPHLLRFLAEMDDVLALAASAAPLFRGHLLWRLLQFGVHALQPEEERLGALSRLGAAAAVAHGSPAVRAGIAACFVVGSSARCGGAATQPAGGVGAQAGVDAPARVARYQLLGPRTRPSADAGAAEAAGADAPQAAGALVAVSRPTRVAMPLPRVRSSGSLGSDDDGATTPRGSPSHPPGGAAGTARLNTGDASDEDAWSDEESDGGDGSLHAPLRAFAWPRAAAALRPPRGRTLPHPAATALADVAVALVLRSDELRVRCEDEVVAVALDAIITAWHGTVAAGQAVAAAPGTTAVQPVTANPRLLPELRRLTAALWDCVRWEYVSPASTAAAVAAVQLLARQGGAVIDVGIDGPTLRAAYDRHRMGLVTSSPAASRAFGLQPPRTSYAGRPRARMLGTSAGVGDAPALTGEVGGDAPTGGGHADAASVPAWLLTSPGAGAIVLLDPDRLALAIGTVLLPPPPPRDARAAAARGAGDGDVQHPPGTEAAPSAAAAPEDAAAPPPRGLQVVFGSHAVQLMLTAGPGADPGAQATGGGVPRLTLGPPAAEHDGAVPDAGAALALDAATQAAAASAQLVGASPATVSRLLRVHRRRSTLARSRSSSMAGGPEADDGGAAGLGTPLWGGGAAGPVSSLLPALLVPVSPVRAQASSGDAAAPDRVGMPADSAQSGAVGDGLPPLVVEPVSPVLGASAPAANEPGDATSGDAVGAAPPPPAPQWSPSPWPPTPALYERVFGDAAGVEPPDAPPPALAASLRAKCGMVEEAFGDVFRHLAVRRGWRTLPFAPAHVAPVFCAAAQVVTLLRARLDAASPGFRMRQVDGAAQSALWSLPPAPALPEPGESAAELEAWRAMALHALVHAALRDGSGQYVEGLTVGEVDAALAGHGYHAAAGGV